MTRWNVVATIREGDFLRGREFLGRFGPVGDTGFYNVLVLLAQDPRMFLDEFEEARQGDPEGGAAVIRAIPVTVSFTFQSAEDFEARAREAATSFLPGLANRSFHVRMRRRGFRRKISGMAEEQSLDGMLKQALADAETPGSVDFTDPDAILALETVGTEAGMSLWTREEIQKYPLLRLD